MKHHWKHRDGQKVYDAGIFEVHKERYDFRGKPAGHPFHILRCRDWVNVVPVTPDGRVVLIRQYRHGVREDCLEIPGGVMDSTDSGPKEAAIRELFEETGYRGDPAISLGSVTSNPAILTNRTHSFCVPNAVLAGAQDLDEHEAIEVEIRPESDILALIQSGEIHHALSVVALLRYLT